AVKKAAVDSAQADLQAARAQVRGIEAQAKSRRENLQHAMEDVANQVSLLRARVAGVEKSKASLKLAELDFERAKQLLPSASIPKQEYDRRQATLSVAQAQLTQSLADVYQIRVSRRSTASSRAEMSIRAIRSLSEIWVDANFKETQLRDLRIGQAADLYVDMYGRRQVFNGRITGFTMGTGSTLALLPPQNATGNFVKVVQRLPVRIELQGYDPDKSPLFIGTSVVPYVYINKPPTGPNPGKFLQAFEPRSPVSSSKGSPAGAEK